MSVRRIVLACVVASALLMAAAANVSAQSVFAGTVKDSSGAVMPGVTVDGNDVVAVYEATKAAADRARAGGGPSLVVGKTYRQRGHYEGDPMVYRSKAEMEEWKHRDPVVGFRARLLSEAARSEAELLSIEKAVQATLNEAVAFAAASPKPEPESALAGVYGETHDGRVF